MKQTHHKYDINTYQQDIFFCLKSATIAKIRDLFEWGHKHAMRTDVYFWEDSNLDKRPAKETFEEVVGYINNKAKTFLELFCVRTGTGFCF
ncbi:MAG: hypothetical protein AB1633_02320 [Elusimicrobiota bacterium]